MPVETLLACMEDERQLYSSHQALAGKAGIGAADGRAAPKADGGARAADADPMSGAEAVPIGGAGCQGRASVDQ